MYVLGQEIEYANGFRGRVVLARDDGYFIVQERPDVRVELGDEPYAACFFDRGASERSGYEVWSFVDDANPFTTLNAALRRINARVEVA